MKCVELGERRKRERQGCHRSGKVRKVRKKKLSQEKSGKVRKKHDKSGKSQEKSYFQVRIFPDFLELRKLYIFSKKMSIFLYNPFTSMMKLLSCDSHMLQLTFQSIKIRITHCILISFNILDHGYVTVINSIAMCYLKTRGIQKM